MPLPAALPFIVGGGMSLLGGILGGKGQRPMIDPAELQRLFGAQAVRDETSQYYNLLKSSPVFANMMRQAGLQGTRAANMTHANLAARGISGTPYGSFLGAASRGYGRGMQLQGQQNLFLQALQNAFSGVQSRQNAYVNSFLQQQATPSWNQMLGSSLLAGGSMGMMQPWGKG